MCFKSFSSILCFIQLHKSLTGSENDQKNTMKGERCEHPLRGSPASWPPEDRSKEFCKSYFLSYSHQHISFLRKHRSFEKHTAPLVWSGIQLCITSACCIRKSNPIRFRTHISFAISSILWLLILQCCTNSNGNFLRAAS